MNTFIRVCMIMLPLSLPLSVHSQETGSLVADTVSDGSVLTIVANRVAFQMVYVEGGTFIMGCTAEQADDCYDWEKPAHQVTLDGFYIGQTEVKQHLWNAVMDGNPSLFPKGDLFPVENVSWDECQEFIARLSRLTGRRFALPTEAQWEYAARGGGKSNGHKYAGGDDIAEVAWYNRTGDGTKPVAMKAPNELGLYDMSGNVWEWCQDLWLSPDPSSPQTNPTGAASGDDRVCRGGSWANYEWICRTACRVRHEPGHKDGDLGLRLVMIP